LPYLAVAVPKRNRQARASSVPSEISIPSWNCKQAASFRFIKSHSYVGDLAPEGLHPTFDKNEGDFSVGTASYICEELSADLKDNSAPILNDSIKVESFGISEIPIEPVAISEPLNPPASQSVPKRRSPVDLDTVKFDQQLMQHIHEKRQLFSVVIIYSMCCNTALWLRLLNSRRFEITRLGKLNCSIV
jgi:hypothetical protein